MAAVMDVITQTNFSVLVRRPAGEHLEPVQVDDHQTSLSTLKAPLISALTGVQELWLFI